ncbi:MAG TPA: hypothetical protein VGG12_08420 [Methylovirgula sp.]|jgi:xanthine dehydrogenase accessory factor
MNEASVLVLGLDEQASAIAHKLHLDGHAVAMHQPCAPKTIRRRMAFADAWFDGSVTFDGVEAKRCDRRKDLLSGLRTRLFVPILPGSFDEVAERWPWDVIVDARAVDARVGQLTMDRAGFTIGVGAGFIAGLTCHRVIDTRARDPGAVLHEGSMGPALARDDPYADGSFVRSAKDGVFHVARFIGETVVPGDILGFVATRAVEAPVAGRLRGLARDGATLQEDDPLAEIAAAKADVSGICQRDLLVARSIAFVIEVERGGWEPMSLEGLLSKP